MAEDFFDRMKKVRKRISNLFVELNKIEKEKKKQYRGIIGDRGRKDEIEHIEKYLNLSEGTLEFIGELYDEFKEEMNIVHERLDAAKEL